MTPADRFGLWLDRLMARHAWWYVPWSVVAALLEAGSGNLLFAVVNATAATLALHARLKHGSAEDQRRAAEGPGA